MVGCFYEEKTNMTKTRAKFEEVGFYIHGIMKRLHSRGRKSLIKEGLTYPEYYVIQLLRDGKPHKMAALKNDLRITGSGTTAVVDKLIKKSLVKRKYSQVDRRIVNVAITDKGENILSSIDSKRSEFLLSMFRGMSDSERKAVFQALKVMFFALKAIDEKKTKIQGE